jgi:organic radical activating enzyme
VQTSTTIGFPNRDVIYEAGEIYRDSDRKVFVTQRGCPMNCSFCFHHAWKKKSTASTTRSTRASARSTT